MARASDAPSPLCQDSYDEVDLREVIVGFLFNTLYYVLVLLIFTAVVSGIIIDSFAEMRVQNAQVPRVIRPQMRGAMDYVNLLERLTPNPRALR